MLLDNLARQVVQRAVSGHTDMAAENGSIEFSYTTTALLAGSAMKVSVGVVMGKPWSPHRLVCGTRTQCWKA